MALESHLRRAGYVFHTGDPLFETLEETKRSLSRSDSAAGSSSDGIERNSATPLELVESKTA
jgi:hypothetical protein